MIAAVGIVVVLVLLSCLQLVLAAGAPLGHYVWGGQHRILPTQFRVGSLLAPVLYAVIAVLALDRADSIDIVSDGVSSTGMWVVFGFFVVEIGVNAMSRSRSERILMVPVTVILAALSLPVALGGSG